MTRRSAKITLAVVLLLAWGALIATQVAGVTPKLGLDLRGGFSVLLEAPSGTDVGVLEKAKDIIERRTEALGGVQEPDISVIEELPGIKVDLPGVTDRERALAAVGTTGQLTFRPVLDSSLGVSPLVIAAQSAAAAEAAAEAAADAEADDATADDGSEDATTTTTTTTTVPEEEEPLDLTPVLPEGITICDGEVDLADQLGCVDGVSGITLSDDPTKLSWLADLESGFVYSLAPARVSGGDLSSTEARFAQTGGGGGGVPFGVSTGGIGEWMVLLEFNSAGADLFTEVTKELAGYPLGDPRRQFAIVLDGEVQSAPQIAEDVSPEEGISGGSAVITLGGSENPEAAARDLSLVLRYGALPVPFEQSEKSVSATLGSDSLRAGLIAGIGGLILVAAAMILYYRALGLVNVIGLSVFGSLVLVIYSLLGASQGVTMTLAGVAGVIVAIGITSDSYIVYFERIKEEVHRGRSLRSAIDHAFARSFRTILTADAVSFAGAILLFLLAVSSVKGFALALGIATVTDVFVAYFFTRPAVALVARSRLGEGGSFSIRGATGTAREGSE